MRDTDRGGNRRSGGVGGSGFVGLNPAAVDGLLLATRRAASEAESISDEIAAALQLSGLSSGSVTQLRSVGGDLRRLASTVERRAIAAQQFKVKPDPKIQALAKTSVAVDAKVADLAAAKRKVTSAGRGVFGSVTPLPGNWAGLDPALVAEGERIAKRVINGRELGFNLTAEEQVAVGAWIWSQQRRAGTNEPGATEDIILMSRRLSDGAILGAVARSREFAGWEYANARLNLPKGAEDVMAFLATEHARGLSDAQLRAEITRRFNGGTPAEMDAFATWLRFQLGNASQGVLAANTFPRPDLLTNDRMFGWVLPHASEPWAVQLASGGAASLNHAVWFPQYLKSVPVLLDWFNGAPITFRDRVTTGVRPDDDLPEWVSTLLIAGLALTAGWYAAGAISGTLAAPMARLVATGTLTQAQATALTIVLTGAGTGVAEGIAMRVGEVVAGRRNPSEILTLRGVLTDAALGTALSITIHAAQMRLASSKSVVERQALERRIREAEDAQRQLANTRINSTANAASTPNTIRAKAAPNTTPPATIPPEPTSTGELLDPDAPAPTVVQRTGTIWDDVTATGAKYPGTEIPKSFRLRLTDGTEIFVNPNSTKHLAEYATSALARGTSANAKLVAQQQIRSLQLAIETVSEGGVSVGRMYRVGGWELQFGIRANDELVVLNHALYVG